MIKIVNIKNIKRICLKTIQEVNYKGNKIGVYFINNNFKHILIGYIIELWIEKRKILCGKIEYIKNYGRD